jgi:hypothetical protein
LCGNVWTVIAPRRRYSFLVCVAAICALLAAVVFSFAAITHHRAANVKNNPLVARISGIHTVVDAFGVPHFMVSGAVINQSDDIYGVPDLLIVSLDDAGNIVARQKFPPSATLLDVGGSVPFSHTLSASAKGVGKIAVELKDQKERP